MAFSISLLKPLSRICSRLGAHSLKAEATLFTQRGSHVRDKRINSGCEASSIEFTDGGTLSGFHGRFPFNKNSGLKFRKLHVLNGTVHSGCTDPTQATARFVIVASQHFTAVKRVKFAQVKRNTSKLRLLLSLSKV